MVAQITPWNYPFMMAIWKIGPALAAGNTLVLKPADTTPWSTLILGELAQEAYPAGVVNVICGGRGTGAAMVDHEIPEMVSITGSTRAGAQVMSAASKTLKDVHLELGGKAPAIVFADIDIDLDRPGDRARRVLQRRAGLHRRDPCAGGGVHPRRVRAPRSPPRPPRCRSAATPRTWAR